MVRVYYFVQFALASLNPMSYSLSLEYYCCCIGSKGLSLFNSCDDKAGCEGAAGDTVLLVTQERFCLQPSMLWPQSEGRLSFKAAAACKWVDCVQ